MLSGLISSSAYSKDVHVRNSNMKILHKSEDKDHQNTVPGEKYTYIHICVCVCVCVWWLEGHISKIHAMDSHIS